jgi:polysaccharide biosynthesis protein PslG
MELYVSSSSAPISSNYFGLTLQAYDYNFGYEGGPVEAWPTIPTSVVRSWDVWSPGAGQVQNLDWADLNASAGNYNWAALDAWIAANQANGAQMVYTFGNIPSWAGGPTTPNLADFQAFVTAVVTQANGAIKYWEGFNEFNVTGISPAVMVQMQEIIYNTVHTLDPGALVLSPTVNSAGADGTFAQFLADGGGQYFDIAAFHGYNNDTGEGLITTVQDFQSMLAQYGLSNTPIWDTEWGMEAPTVLTGATNQEAFVSTGLILQAALGVQTELFYSYDNSDSALYDSATGQLTPAGVAYQETEQWLTGATLPSGYQLNGSVYTVQLVKNGQNDLLVWNSAGQSSFSAGSFTEYVNAQGQVEPVVGGVVTIGTVPILLEDSELQAPTITSASPDSTAG